MNSTIEPARAIDRAASFLGKIGGINTSCEVISIEVSVNKRLMLPYDRASDSSEHQLTPPKFCRCNAGLYTHNAHPISQAIHALTPPDFRGRCSAHRMIHLTSKGYHESRYQALHRNQSTSVIQATGYMLTSDRLCCLFSSKPHSEGLADRQAEHSYLKITIHSALSILQGRNARWLLSTLPISDRKRRSTKTLPTQPNADGQCTLSNSRTPSHRSM
ncbi:uncharacterized protein RAG0_02654 [Rhynchosporium agropyri]|uniref:Uncharacterized protein n=1 Tax=Rhynchosporium agropyri TaxID=914238 RepID=A0A1E1K291_9HELO|nr:uncharacterized protein RAG0_02654 [Rhynchosporium agropyri]